MKSNSSIYLISMFPKFNRDEMPNFETFNNENSFQLYSSLIFNHIELLTQLDNSYQIFFCLDEKDQDFLPNEFKSSHSNLIFINTSNRSELFKILLDKYLNQTNKNLLIFASSIGMNSIDVKRVFNLLSVDDEAVVIGKSNNNNLAFIGSNSINNDLFSNIDWENLNYENVLSNVNKHDNFVNVLDNYLVVKNLDDFKNLYKELSKKESLAYCSEAMHEKFTNLFIEYKELLK